MMILSSDDRPGGHAIAVAYVVIVDSYKDWPLRQWIIDRQTE